MSRDFEELDFQTTPLGELSLRRRRLLSLGGMEIFEVKLGEDFLMSSLFHEVEVALARMGLSEIESPPPWDVVVGGLGLGYTAAAALEDSRVGSVLVVEALDPVLAWHRRGMVPLGPTLAADPHCRLIHGDFFSLADSREGFDLEQPGRRFHAVLLDIDHSPRDLLHARHASFYQRDGLSTLAAHLVPRGVFAMWSDEAPDAEFVQTLESVFEDVRAEVVAFDNPLTESRSASTVYVSRKKR